MYSQRRDIDYLEDILEATERITEYVNELSFDDFLARPMVQDAVVRNIQIVGEATKLVSGQFRAQHPDNPWQPMAGTRDRVVHHYFGVNLEIVWQVATRDLPDVAAQSRAAVAGSAADGDS